MKIAVEGAITSIEVKEKDEKVFTELLLAQQGEREQVKVRLNGDRTDEFDMFQVESFQGRLMTWKQREGIGSMVMAD